MHTYTHTYTCTHKYTHTYTRAYTRAYTLATTMVSPSTPSATRPPPPRACSPAAGPNPQSPSTATHSPQTSLSTGTRHLSPCLHYHPHPPPRHKHPAQPASTLAATAVSRTHAAQTCTTWVSTAEMTCVTRRSRCRLCVRRYRHPWVPRWPRPNAVVTRMHPAQISRSTPIKTSANKR